MAPKKDFSMEDAMRMAKSPAGQQLMNELQKRNGSALQQAADKAAAGDYESARQLLSGMLESKEIRDLLRQLGG